MARRGKCPSMENVQPIKVTLDVLIPDQERMARVLRALVLTTSSTRVGATTKRETLVGSSAKHRARLLGYVMSVKQASSRTPPMSRLQTRASRAATPRE